MKEILIFVAGLTPQVVTETLYCLTQTYKPRRKVSEIYVLTTSLGRERALQGLLHEKRGNFYALCNEYKLDPGAIRFDSDHIVVVPSKDGSPLTDIRTPDDNKALADFIIHFVRDKASNPDITLHCSVAGGRKTMSLFLGLALQFFGRPQDRLSHVLIWPPELEGNPDFFYPPKKSRIYQIGDSKVHSSDVKISLAEIPLLLLKERIPILKEKNGFTYSQLVRRVQEDFELLSSPPHLHLDRVAKSLRIGGKIIPLTPLEFALYQYLAQRKIGASCPSLCGGCERCFIPASHFLDNDTLADLKNFLKQMGVRDERSLSLKGWFGPSGVDRLYQVRSSLNNKIRKGLEGGTWSHFYEISAIKPTTTTDTLYGVSLDKRLITVK